VGGTSQWRFAVCSAFCVEAMTPVTDEGCLIPTKGYLVPGRKDDEQESATSSVNVVKGHRKGKSSVAVASGALLTLFSKRK
jgi:hypothetical protein